MPLLYNRQLQVEVAGLTIKDLRIVVDIDRQMDRTQDKGRCDIYNLSPAHEQRIYERGGPITIQAGYPSTVAILFEGEVQRVIRAREELSRITRISLGDQVRSRKRLGGVFLRSYDGQISIRQIVTDIIDAMGMTAGPLDAIPSVATFENFYWGGDPAASALDAALRPVQCTWFEQDGVIRVNKIGGEQQTDARTIEVNPDTGLIDSPIATDEGAEVRTFMNARITLGSIIDLESESLSGRWKVVGVRHSGDNWSGSFESFCDLRAL